MRTETAVPVEHPYVGGIRWALMRWADIPDANDPTRVYLRRLRVVQTPLFAVYLHFIYLPDDDRDPHDHPWTFWSLILRGGYTETVYSNPANLSRTRELRHRRFSLHRMPTTRAHRITTRKPHTTTLVWGGRRNREWGFWTPDGWVHFAPYVAAKEARTRDSDS